MFIAVQQVRNFDIYIRYDTCRIAAATISNIYRQSITTWRDSEFELDPIFQFRRSIRLPNVYRAFEENVLDQTPYTYKWINKVVLQLSKLCHNSSKIEKEASLKAWQLQPPWYKIGVHHNTKRACANDEWTNDEWNLYLLISTGSYAKRVSKSKILSWQNGHDIGNQGKKQSHQSSINIILILLDVSLHDPSSCHLSYHLDLSLNIELLETLQYKSKFVSPFHLELQDRVFSMMTSTVKLWRSTYNHRQGSVIFQWWQLQ